MAVSKNIELLSRVRECLEKGHLSFRCQPIYHVATGRLDSAELLVRMEDPEIGLIIPEEFIPLAEENALIPAIDLAVVEHGLELLEKLAVVDGFASLSVNLSPQTLENREYVRNLLVLGQKHRRVCHMLTIEITETAPVADIKVVAAAMELLRALGVTLAIDDFGSGEADVGRCMDLPAEIVKLDMTLIRRLGTPRGERALKEIVRAFHNMGQVVVAEGVETESDVRVLCRCGCDYLQGYYFSYPLPEEVWLAQPVVYWEELRM